MQHIHPALRAARDHQAVVDGHCHPLTCGARDRLASNQDNSGGLICVVQAVRPWALLAYSICPPTVVNELFNSVVDFTVSYFGVLSVWDSCLCCSEGAAGHGHSNITQGH